ncbi:Sterile alpha and TIR motif-containing protein 1 [Irineochytrium annulatum]|nr:Sterile alpha and TIR motif-containing protein 1 [Irineochytrium annulatum]
MMGQCGRLAPYLTGTPLWSADDSPVDASLRCCNATYISGRGDVSPSLSVACDPLARITALNMTSVLVPNATELFLTLTTLSQLKALYLSRCKLASLFAALPLSPGLVNLTLSNNPQLVGPLHDLSTSVPLLERLVLSGNNITGPVPPSIGMLPRLQRLDLSQNQLSGQIPATFGNAFALQYLDLSYNNLTGPIPPLPASVQTMRMRNNMLSGGLPDFSAFTNLTELNLQFNNFTGTIPATLATKNLSVVALNSNQLSGKIPDQLFQISALKELDVSQNNLTGGLSQDWGGLQQLMYFYAQSNQLTGSVPAFTSPVLSALYLKSNALSGSLPPLPKNLQNLVVAMNALTGPIPDTYANFTRMLQLDLVLQSASVWGNGYTSDQHHEQFIRDQFAFGTITANARADRNAAHPSVGRHLLAAGGALPKTEKDKGGRDEDEGGQNLLRRAALIKWYIDIRHFDVLRLTHFSGLVTSYAGTTYTESPTEPICPPDALSISTRTFTSEDSSLAKPSIFPRNTPRLSFDQIQYEPIDPRARLGPPTPTTTVSRASKNRLSSARAVVENDNLAPPSSSPPEHQILEGESDSSMLPQGASATSELSWVSALGGSSSGSELSRFPWSWKPASVLVWLRQCGFSSDVLRRFYENEVDGRALLRLTMDELKVDLGITSVQTRESLFDAISRLKQSNGVTLHTSICDKVLDA